MQRKQKNYHDRSTVQLDKLRPQQPVLMQTGHREWIPGKIVKELDSPRSYIVKTSTGTEFRRNRVHLKPDKAQIKQFQETLEQPNKKDESIPVQTSSLPVVDSEQTHSNEFRSPTGDLNSPPKRDIKLPARFKDYILKTF